jgi:hypothetical protein
MKNLDKSKDGVITRNEWMEYLCVNKHKKGELFFRGRLKKKFI